MILEKVVPNNGRVVHSIARNRGKELIDPDDVDTLADELSSGSSSPLSLSLAKDTRESTKAKSHKRPSQHPTFSDVICGASCRASR